MKRRPIFTEVVLLNAIMVALATASAALVTGFSTDHLERLLLIAGIAAAVTCLLNVIILRRRFTPLEAVITEMEKA